jgi:hypothetical protein
MTLVQRTGFEWAELLLPWDPEARAQAARRVKKSLRLRANGNFPPQQQACSAFRTPLDRPLREGRCPP